jgi:hypothetical protein
LHCRKPLLLSVVASHAYSIALGDYTVAPRLNSKKLHVTPMFVKVDYSDIYSAILKIDLVDLISSKGFNE